MGVPEFAVEAWRVAEFLAKVESDGNGVDSAGNDGAIEELRRRSIIFAYGGAESAATRRARRV